MILIDPATRKPLPAIAGERPRPESQASHWVMERDERGVVVRMRWVERLPTADEVRGILK